jgi:hypothetical protein
VGVTTVAQALSSALSVLESISGTPGQADRGVLQFLQRNKRFADLAEDLAWPPPWHLPVHMIDCITNAHAKGELSNADVEAAFLMFYTPEVVQEFAGRWEGYEWLASRLPIFREGLINHLEGRYFSAVCTLLPQIEGVLADELGRKPIPKCDAGILFRNSRLGSVAKDFYIRVVLESFNWASEAPVPTLSRHAILHGRATLYGTRTHSLKVAIITDIVLSGVEERRTSDAQV